MPPPLSPDGAGGTLSGWLVGLPLTSGPVLFFLAIDQGGGFATSAALAVLLGTISQALRAARSSGDGTVP